MEVTLSAAGLAFAFSDLLSSLVLSLDGVQTVHPLRRKLQAVERSMRNTGDLLSTTKDICETDLNLAIPTVISATVQITLFKQILDSFSSQITIGRTEIELQSISALDDIYALAADIDNLHQILIIAYWDGVDPTPVAEHSTLDQELMASRAYQARVFQEHLSPEDNFDLLQILDDEQHSDTSTDVSIPCEVCSTLCREQKTGEPLLDLQLSDRSTVDEAFDLVPVRKFYETSLTTEDYKSTSAFYLSGSNILTGPGKAPHMYMRILMRGCSGIEHELNCLLDTGASVDCISKSQAKLLEPRSAGLIRRTKYPLILQTADRDMIESELLFRGAWNFVNRDTEYAHLFHLIDGLPTDVSISRPTIFQYGFLFQNPDLLPLGLPDGAVVYQN